MIAYEFNPKGQTFPITGFDPNRDGVAVEIVDGNDTWAYMGLSEGMPHKAEAWLHVTAEGLSHGPVVARVLRRAMEREIKSGYWSRIQVVIPEQHEPCLKLASWLGFEREGCLRRAGPLDEDCIVFGRII